MHGAIRINDLAASSALLCLTTLRHQRFVEDVINIVGLPVGSRVRLRYRTRYVSREVMLEAEQGRLVGRPMLIALGATSMHGVTEVAPLRVARVVEVSVQGELLLLDSALGEFACEPWPEGNFWRELSAGCAVLPEDFASSRASPGQYVSFLAANVSCVTLGSTAAEWERVALRVMDLDQLANAAMPRIPFAYSISSTTHSRRELGVLGGEISMDSGSWLELELQYITRRQKSSLLSPIGEVVLELSHGDATFATSRRIRVDASRDAKKVRIVSGMLFRPAMGHLSIRVVQFDFPATDGVSEEQRLVLASAKDRTERTIARFDVPLSVGRWRPAAASTGVALTSGAVAWSLPEDGESMMAAFAAPLLIACVVFVALYFGFWRDGGK